MNPIRSSRFLAPYSAAVLTAIAKLRLLRYDGVQPALNGGLLQFTILLPGDNQPTFYVPVDGVTTEKIEEVYITTRDAFLENNRIVGGAAPADE